MGYGLVNAAEEYAKLGEELGKAKNYNDEALNIFIRLGEKRMIGACHAIYGVIYHRKKEWDKSEENFEKAVKIAGEVEDLEGLSQYHCFYGRMLVDKGDPEGARVQYQKSIEVYEKLGNNKKVEEIRKEIEELRVKELRS
ncbi:MAG: tetratricopeptide repeat protein [Thermoplasmatales archaeon]|nr:tetratricopeptide repeat protein [Thermoplasmatales archaeon]